MLSRIALVVSLVACGGGSKQQPPPAQPQPAAEPPPVAETVKEDPPPPPAAEPPAAPPRPPAFSYDQLRDEGDVPGMPGFVRKRTKNAAHCGGFAVVVTRGKKVVKDDEPLAAVLKLEFPKGLNFDPDPKNKKRLEASKKKFDAFVLEMTKVGGDATKHYEAKLGTDASANVAAAARMAQIAQHMSSLLARAEIPADVRTGEMAAEKIDAFCSKMVEVAEPLHWRAAEATEVCAAKLKDVPAGWWNDVCVAR